MIYEYGEGVPQNEAEACKRYRKLAENGDHYAQEKLARMYVEGRGVEKDESVAFEWFCKATQGSSTKEKK